MLPTMTFADLVRNLIGLMNAAIGPLIGFAIAFFFVGLIRYIYRSGDAKGRAAGRSNIVWGLIGLFLIFCLWGIINLMQANLFPQTATQQSTGFVPSTNYSPNQTNRVPIQFVPDTQFQHTNPTTPAQQVQGGIAPL